MKTSRRLFLLSAIVAIFLLPPSAHADDWQVLQMRPSVLLTDLVFLPDGLHGWSVGSSSSGGLQLSVALRTTDGGTTWEELPLPDPSGVMLQGVDFVSVTHGWIVGNDGLVLATTDGGGSWLPQNSGTGRPLRKVDFVDEQIGWVVGGFGESNSYLVLKTSNGGATWANQSFGSSAYSCDDVKFADALNGWIGGYDSSLNPHIHHTTDGGTSWARQSVPVPAGSGTVSAIDFCDPLVGWASVSSLYQVPSGAILHTTDGGTNWSVQTYTGYHYNYALDCQDLNRVAVASVRILSPQSQRVFVTSNGGTSWNSYAPPIVSYTYGIQFVGSDLWIASDYSQILRSTNDGVDWDWVHHAPLWRSLTFSSETNAWLVSGSGVGTDGYCFRSSDGGGSWNRDPSAPGGSIVSFVDADHGWMLREGNASSVRRTTNGGGSWSEFSVGTGQYVSGMFFLDTNTGWVCGGNGTIRKSTNGGASWFAQPAGTSAYVQTVEFLDANEGWAAGGLGSGNGFIRHTTDGGTSWSPQVPATPDHILDLCFLDQSRGWLAGVGGRVQRTSDGGGSWQVVGQVPHDFVDQIEMKNENEGWLAARNLFGGGPGEDGRGFIYSTSNGGGAWSLQWEAPWPKGFVTALAFDPVGGVWACGGHDQLLASRASTDAPELVLVPGAVLRFLPNPITARSQIRYQVPESAHVRLSVFDVVGRPVVTLVDRHLSAGAHMLAWDGTSSNGRRLPSGVYFGRLELGDRALVRRITIAR